MKLRHYFYLIVFCILLSCNSKEIEGLWFHSKEGENCMISTIREDSLSIIFFSEYNYFTFKNEEKLKKVSNGIYKNERLKLICRRDDSLYVEIIRDDGFKENIVLSQVLRYNQGKLEDKFENVIKNKQIKYKIKENERIIDILNENYSIVKGKYYNQTRLNYYDILRFDKELFLIDDTDNIIPVQIIKISESNVKGKILPNNEMVEIDIKSREMMNFVINESWKSEAYKKGNKINNSMSKMDFTNRDVLIYQKERVDTFEWLIAENNLILIDKENRIRPQYLPIKKVTDNEFILENKKKGTKRIFEKKN